MAKSEFVTELMVRKLHFDLTIGSIDKRAEVGVVLLRVVIQVVVHIAARISASHWESSARAI